MDVYSDIGHKKTELYSNEEKELLGLKQPAPPAQNPYTDYTPVDTKRPAVDPSEPGKPMTHEPVTPAYVHPNPPAEGPNPYEVMTSDQLFPGNWKTLHPNAMRRCVQNYCNMPQYAPLSPDGQERD